MMLIVVVILILMPHILIFQFPGNTPNAGVRVIGVVFWISIFFFTSIFIHTNLTGKHFRIDCVQIDFAGFIVDFSHIPRAGGNYVNNNIFVPWSNVKFIEACSDSFDGGVSYSILIELHDPFYKDMHKLELPYGLTDGNMRKKYELLQKIAPGSIFYIPNNIAQD